MSNIVFQRPRGTAWEFRWTDKHSNLIQSAAAPGFETRISLGPDPLRTLELNYAILLAGAKGGTRDQLVGFFNLRRGDFDSFLIDLGALTSNPADSSIVGQILDVDYNGYAPITLTRYVSAAESWQENVYELAGVNGNPGTAPVLRLDDEVLVSGTDYDFMGPGFSISGRTFPGLMVIITRALGSPRGIVTADFSWLYRVRFEQPEQEYEMFHHLLWKAQKISVVTTRT